MDELLSSPSHLAPLLPLLTTTYHNMPPSSCHGLCSEGAIAKALAKQARYMETIKDRGPWARFWANMGGVEHAVAPLIYDSVKYMASGLDSYYRWAHEWFGKSVHVAIVFSLISTDVNFKNNINLRPVDTAIDDGARLALVLDGNNSVAPVQHGIGMLIHLSQVPADAAARPRILFLTFNAQGPAQVLATACKTGAAHGGVLGLTRVLQLEQKAWNGQSMDLAYVVRNVKMRALDEHTIEAELKLNGEEGTSGREKAGGGGEGCGAAGMQCKASASSVIPLRSSAFLGLGA